MNPSVAASQTGLLSGGMFKRLFGDAGRYTTGTSLSFRLGSAGEESRDIVVVGVFHRSPLTPAPGFTLVASQAVDDSTGLEQTLSVFYRTLQSSDLGRAFVFSQELPDRMGLCYSVYRPAVVMGSVTLVAQNTASSANTGSPWSLAPVTATKVGQLMVALQTRVAAQTDDRYSTSGRLAQSTRVTNSEHGARLFMADTIYRSEATLAEEVTADSELIPETSTASISLVFDLAPSAPAIPSTLKWVSAGAGGTVDLLESGKLLSVRDTASVSQWHMAAGDAPKSYTTDAANWYYEVEILAGAPEGAGPVCAIGIAEALSPTYSGSGAESEPGIQNHRQFFNDATYRNPPDGSYIPLGSGFKDGDTVAIMLSLRTILSSTGLKPLWRSVFMRLYVNGVQQGEVYIDAHLDDLGSSIRERPLVPFVTFRGPGGKARLKSPLSRLPDGCRAW